MAAIAAGVIGGLGILNWLGGHGQRLTITDNITTTMTINAVFSSITNCFESTETEQSIDFEGKNYPEINGAWCLDAIKSIYDARNNLEYEAEEKSRGAYVHQEATANLEATMLTGASEFDKDGTIGPCALMTHSIVVSNIQQTTSFKSTGDCNVTNVDVNDIQQSIQGQIDASLTNKEDILSSLEDIFVTNRDTISTDIATDMTQNITSKFIQSLYSHLLGVQIIDVTGNSLYLNNVKQSMKATQIGTLLVNNTVNDQLSQSAKYQLTQTLLNKNDTIGDLSQDFLQVIETLGDLMDELASQILILLGAILAGVIMIGLTLYLTNKNFRAWVGAKAHVGAQYIYKLDKDYQSRKENLENQQETRQAELMEHKKIAAGESSEGNE